MTNDKPSASKTPKADALRQMREANYARRKAGGSVSSEEKRVRLEKARKEIEEIKGRS